MKKTSFLILCLMMVASVCSAQEWFTSFDVAKRLALVQNKMLFVIWENSFQGSIPVAVRNDKGQLLVIDLAKDKSMDAIINDYFVPVRLSEAVYADFMKDAQDRGYQYIDKLNDDSIKIMDVNGRILNVKEATEDITILSDLIVKYALDTSFLEVELRNYINEKNYFTAYFLAAKYIDYTIYANEALRPELIDLANIYLEESRTLLENADLENKAAVLQKIELSQIEELLILKQARKARRQLNRIEVEDVDDINQRLFSFLHFIISSLQQDDNDADVWKSKISSLDLKKAELILNINGSSD